MAVMATALANLSRMKEQLRDSAEGMKYIKIGQ